MDTKILIVDDEPEIVAFTKDYLQDQGYQVITAYNGQEALRSLQRQPNMIILDIMMPGMDGFELCELVRKRVTCPIIFLSAKHSEEDRIRGLMVGGDDYLTKPFSLKELHARIIAHLRREHRLAEETKKCLYFGNLMIDLEGYEVYYLNERLSFTSKEFEMIQFLALHPGQVFSREKYV